MRTKSKTCHNANKKDRMQTKQTGCKQKRLDANKKDRMQTKKIECKKNQNLSRCKQKRSDANTKKIGCKHKKDWMQTKNQNLSRCKL